MAYCKDVIVKLETTYDIRDPKRTSIAAIGSHVILGNWDENRPLLAINTTGNQWEIYISAKAGIRIQWQWIIYDMKKIKVLFWEDKDNNRELVVPSIDSHIIVPWNKAESGPFPLSIGPSCDPYVTSLQRDINNVMLLCHVRRLSNSRRDTCFTIAITDTKKKVFMEKMTYNEKYIIVKLETSYDISDPESASVAAIGSHVTLGNWNENRPLLAINKIDNQWEIYISARAGTRIYWKWIVYDLRNRKILLSEDKFSVRELVVPFNDSHIIVPWNKTQNRPLPLSEGPSCDLKGFTVCVNSEYIKSYHTAQPARIYYSRDIGNTVVGAMALGVVFYSVYRRLF